MGNGMCEKFNKTLLNMLGTLNEHQKVEWKSCIPTLTHAYNAAMHKSTGFAPFSFDVQAPSVACSDNLKQRRTYAKETAARQVETGVKEHKHIFYLNV